MKTVDKQEGKTLDIHTTAGSMTDNFAKTTCWTMDMRYSAAPKKAENWLWWRSWSSKIRCGGDNVIRSRADTYCSSNNGRGRWPMERGRNPPTPRVGVWEQHHCWLLTLWGTLNTVPAHHCRCSELPLYLCQKSFLTASSQPAPRPAPDASSLSPLGHGVRGGRVLPAACACSCSCSCT